LEESTDAVLPAALNLEALQEVSDAVEQVDKRIVAGANVLGCLKEDVDFSSTTQNQEGEGDTNHKEETNTAEDCRYWWQCL
jgi:hypothetical protein